MRTIARVLATALVFLAVSAFYAIAPAQATEATVSYSVTDSETTAVDLELDLLSDNLDYEADHVRTDADAELGCDLLTATAPLSGYTYSWYECTVPASEAPEGL